MSDHSIRTSSWIRFRGPLIAVLSATLLLAACLGTPSYSAPLPSPAAPTATVPAPTASLVAVPSASASPLPLVASAPPSSPPGPTPPVMANCTTGGLVARIVNWNGAMGSRIATVELTNTGAACRLAVMDRPQLIEGHGAILIDGTAPTNHATLTLALGALFKTMVRASNYCGPAPTAPVSVAFVLAGSAGRILALAVSPTDLTGLPPCNGAPGSAGSVDMQAWAP